MKINFEALPFAILVFVAGFYFGEANSTLNIVPQLGVIWYDDQTITKPVFYALIIFFLISVSVIKQIMNSIDDRANSKPEVNP